MPGEEFEAFEEAQLSRVATSTTTQHARDRADLVLKKYDLSLEPLSRSTVVYGITLVRCMVCLRTEQTVLIVHIPGTQIPRSKWTSSDTVFLCEDEDENCLLLWSLR
jgi:hypothetical protein